MKAVKRGPGRPPKPSGDVASTHIDVRVTPELRREIREAASESGLNMGAWLKQAAEEKLKRQRRRGQVEEGTA